MPLVPSKDAGNIGGLVHSHRFPGANTALPVINQDGCGEERGAEKPLSEAPQEGLERLQTEPANPPSDGSLRFVDITEPAGIWFVYRTGAFGKKHMPETMGSVGCFLDFDNDGFVGLYITALGPNRLFRNNGNGTFTDVRETAAFRKSGNALRVPS